MYIHQPFQVYFPIPPYRPSHVPAMRMTPRVTLRALATASLLWSVFFASRTAATAAAAAPAWWRASHLRVDVESKSELEQPSGASEGE